MKLSELRYVVAVAQERNFRKAAERCYISQPALSLAIQKLEGELGIQIFERSRSEVTVTPTGALVIEQAQLALEQVDRIKEVAQQGRDQLRGPLHLGAIYTVGPYLLPELIPQLLQSAPNMPLEVEENLTVNLEALLRNGKLDVAIIALPFDVPGILTKPLYDEPFNVAVPASHRLAERSSIKAQELMGEKVLLLGNGHCFSTQVLDACPELNRYGEIQQGNSLETIRNMVASGLGITVLPSSANWEHYRSGLVKIIPFDEPVPSRRIALAWRKSFTRPKVIDVLSEAVHALHRPSLRLL